MSADRPTPETDAAQLVEAETRWGVKPQVWPLVRADFARRLERERDEARAECDRLTKRAEKAEADLIAYRAESHAQQQQAMQQTVDEHRAECERLRADAERVKNAACDFFAAWDAFDADIDGVLSSDLHTKMNECEVALRSLVIVAIDAARARKEGGDAK